MLTPLQAPLVQYWAVFEYIFLPSGDNKCLQMSGMLFFFSSWWDESDEDLKKVYRGGLGVLTVIQV